MTVCILAIDEIIQKISNQSTNYLIRFLPFGLLLDLVDAGARFWLLTEDWLWWLAWIADEYFVVAANIFFWKQNDID